MHQDLYILLRYMQQPHAIHYQLHDGQEQVIYIKQQLFWKY